MKPDVNSVEVHLQVSHNGHPVDGVLVGAGSLWLSVLYPLGISLGYLLRKLQNVVQNWDSCLVPTNRVDKTRTGH